MNIVSLGGFVRIRTGKLDANASSQDGKYEFFTCAIEPLKISSYSYDCECVLVAGNGDLNVKYYDGKFDAYQRTYIIESNDKKNLDVRYLFHFMSKYVETLRKGSIGGVIKYIKLGHLTEAKIPLPPLEEQKRIAAILDKADAIRKKRKQAIELTEQFLRSAFLDMFGDPITNPKGWTISKLETLGTLDRGKSKHRPRNDPKLLGGQYPLIQTGDVAASKGAIKEYTSTYSEMGLKQSRLWPAGTLCITIAANIAKTGILTFDACFPDSVVGFTSNERTTTEFIQFWISFYQHILEETAPESAQKNINLKILREIKIPTPPIELQNEFTAIVEKTRKLMSRFETIEQSGHNLFYTLTQRAFQGEL